MDVFFHELGSVVLKRWKAENFSLAKFPAIAESALSERPPALHFDVEEFLRVFLLDDAQPSQTESGFGEPEIIVYENPRFYIQLLFWLDGTTAIHQHEFSGAFHVLRGSSIHTRFDFQNANPVTPYFRMGDLRMREMALLETGMTVPIVSGSTCIHSLFHLDTPSVTVVVRTQHDPGTGPQFNYLPPHVAYDPVFSDPLILRRRQVLEVLEQVQDPAYGDLVLGMIDELDFERGFHTLRGSMGYLRDLGEWSRVIAAFHKRHGVLAEGVGPTLDECRRRDVIKGLRGATADPEHRFFLALLLNARSREGVISLIHERFPEAHPMETIFRWVEELLHETDFGFAILDVVFPAEADVDLDEQPGVFLDVLRACLDPDFKLSGGPAKTAWGPIRTALEDSSFARLLV